MTSVAGGAAVVGEGAAPRSCGLGKGRSGLARYMDATRRRDLRRVRVSGPVSVGGASRSFKSLPFGFERRRHAVRRQSAE